MLPLGRKEVLEAIVINASTAIVAALAAWAIEVAKSKTTAKPIVKTDVPTIILPSKSKGT